MVGTAIDQDYLENLKNKAASLISRTIFLTLFTPATFEDMKGKIKPIDIFLLWEAKTPIENYPNHHSVSQS